MLVFVIVKKNENSAKAKNIIKKIFNFYLNNYFYYFAKQNHIQKTLGYIAEIFFLIDQMQALIFDQRIFFKFSINTY